MWQQLQLASLPGTQPVAGQLSISESELQPGVTNHMLWSQGKVKVIMCPF